MAYSVFHCFVELWRAFIKSERKSLTREWNAHAEDFWTCANVPLVGISSILCVFCIFRKLNSSMHTMVWAPGAFCALRICCRLYALFYWNRLPTAEWERHYLQHGSNNQNTECKCIECMHAKYYVYKCLTTCIVQTTVAPPSWSVYVSNGLLFWLWQVFCKQSPRITSFMVCLHNFRGCWEAAELRCQSHVAVLKPFCMQKLLVAVRAGCQLRAQMWFGLTFTDVFGPCYAHVS